MTIIAATLLIRPVMKPDSLEIGELFVAMPFGLLVGLMMDNFSEMAMLVESRQLGIETTNTPIQCIAGAP